MTAEEILYNHKLKNTTCRKQVVEELLEKKSALSENEIKSAFEGPFDRVTFYRTLKTLEQKEVIHRIALNDGTIKYALNGHHHENEHIHAHFHCEKCDEVFCLEEEQTYFHVDLPDKFVKNDVFVVVEGVCAECVVDVS
ncbi:MAG TPA: transcriptional repressor [Porphyromonadaceae bacterium]|jgi:Fur family ferric uptake transcriptional regulator|uniref:Fur family transcriptional regulator n=1 Tax=Limibacterium fermenti TaxID=3229863 RepID=UPI000E94893B|nr:transcriptional repressor [Porphyromonadaceae bacterium]HBK32063.1 transcriptional repressor [Porphyromonadaceae bacterium]HBL32872.1 transcriptional repressor [Porphyromonadaceae bacterium]HBX19533.1 transcriptional repressor [Porphyromonadaceae bacterium]HBX46587.1 transcriptional repressor [Porphyromonadaceae bacterium]